MLKRFYSKRSGFTLVEIIVAFAVFAIMASMICQMLDLAVRARQSNNAYQRELDTQEHLLTLVEKNSENFKDPDGTIKLPFDDGTVVELPFDRLSAMTDAEFDSQGLNYFLAPVNYQSDGEVTPNGGSGSGGGANSGSQASRMDTRITGTGGISNIQIIYVVKDTHNYAPGDPMAIPAGHTRYFFMTSASCGSMPQTLKDEDVPYSQYRLHFYHQPDGTTSQDKSEYLNMPACAVEYTDKDNKKYTKDVYKTAVITKVGYIKNFDSAKNNGLQTSNISEGTDNNNKYTIEQMGTNVVRIGSPFTTGNGTNGGLNGRGVKFTAGNASKFYVEFEGDPHLTVESFGYNAATGDVTGSKKYAACPNYLEEYNSDGTPAYDYEGYHVNIYGAFMPTRHYK
ncbi:MAG: prepilin-type N-terminal cleavage/methylation domain-containing protein [Oscillospiraceae bacterium]|nr:prepilin-type N-terminal cleavage/methylation domain-containing protein [Oscillospiraceae bacterium]